MLRTYGPDCDGSIVDPEHGTIPPGATWIDLEEPTREEEKAVEKAIGQNVPTKDEMAEIEPSSRLFERNGALYMTLSALRGVKEGEPQHDADRFRAHRQPPGHGALCDAQAGVRIRRPRSARTRAGA